MKIKRIISVVLIVAMLMPLISVEAFAGSIADITDPVDHLVEFERITYSGEQFQPVPENTSGAIGHLEDVAARQRAESDKLIAYNESELSQTFRLSSAWLNIFAGAIKVIPGVSSVASTVLSSLAAVFGATKMTDIAKITEMMQAIGKRFDAVDQKLDSISYKIGTGFNDLKEYISVVSKLSDYSDNLKDFTTSNVNKFPYENGYDGWKERLVTNYDLLMTDIASLDAAKEALEKCTDESRRAELQNTVDSCEESVKWRYDNLFATTVKSDVLYNEFFSSNGQDSIQQIYYEYHLLAMHSYNTETAKDVMTYAETLIADMYNTYAFAMECRTMCNMYQLLNLDSNGKYTAEAYDGTGNVSITVNEIIIRDYLNGFSDKVDHVQTAVLQSLSYMMGMDMTYIYAADKNNAGSYVTVPYRNVYDAEEFVKIYGTDPDTDIVSSVEMARSGLDSEYKYIVTNNRVNCGATLFLSEMPEFFDNMFDKNEMSFEITYGAQSASVDRNGIVTVTGNAGDEFTVSLKYGNAVLYSLPFVIDEKHFSGGMGTEGLPYLISTVDDMNHISGTDYSCFRMINDITFPSNTSFTAIPSFTGIFDGNGFCIYDMKGTVTKTGTDNIEGIFVKENNGVIENLNFDNPVYTISLKWKEAKYGHNVIGGICGKNNGTLKNNSVNSGSVSLLLEPNDFIYTLSYEHFSWTTISFGGFAGINSGTVEKCRISGLNMKLDFEPNELPTVRLGGLIGYMEVSGASVKNCYVNSERMDLKCNSPFTNGDKNDIGMIVGKAKNATIDKCIGYNVKREYEVGTIISDMYAQNPNIMYYHYSYQLNSICGSTSNCTVTECYAADNSADFSNKCENIDTEAKYHRPAPLVSLSSQVEQINPTSVHMAYIPIYEYAIREEDSESELVWQKNSAFSGLENGKTYIIYTRYAETPKFYASDENAGIKVTAELHPIEFGKYAELQNAIYNAPDETEVCFRLSDDIDDMTDSLEIPEGKIVTIDLYGHNIDRCKPQAETGGQVIEVYGELTVCDSLGGGKITGGNILTRPSGFIGSTNHGSGVYIGSGAKFTLSGGNICGNSSAYSGGGVYAKSDAEFIMNGGVIENNTAAENGGGVYMGNHGSFTLSGGIIRSNKAETGAGVYYSGSEMNLSGSPKIIDNTDSDLQNSNIFVEKDSYITTDHLTSDALFGIQSAYFMDGSGAFIVPLSTECDEDYSNCFVPDIENQCVSYDSYYKILCVSYGVQLNRVNLVFNDDDTFSVVTSGDDDGNGLLFVGFYNDESASKLNSIRIFNISSGEKARNLPLDKDSKFVKAVWWSLENKMTPYCLPDAKAYNQ